MPLPRLTQADISCWATLQWTTMGARLPKKRKVMPQVIRFMWNRLARWMSTQGA